MIRFLGWCVVVALLVTAGWYGRDAVTALEKSPVRVTVGVGSAQAAPPAKKVAAPQAPQKASPKAVPAYRDPAERDNVGPGFATQGIGYYDVRGSSR